MKTYFIFLLVLLFSCNKQDEWLDQKSNIADVVPVSLKDFQALLDYTGTMNTTYTGMGMIGADNFYATTATWLASATKERNAYIWAKDIFEGESAFDWSMPYAMVEISNIVLDGIQKITPAPNDEAASNNIRGSAFFFRAYAFYNLAQLFAAPYDPASPNTALGIPLRLSSDVNIISVRSTVQQTYARITADLQLAIALLPVVPVAKTRPSQVAAQALLARVYLAMGDYDNALQYASAALAANSTLIDFNTLNTAASFPFPAYQNNNPEVLFYAENIIYSITSSSGSRAVVDTQLYNSYDPNDLRKKAFYTVPNAAGQVFFKGEYTGTLNTFGGIGTNELYLIQAECHARKNNAAAAITSLNALLQKRWLFGKFVPFTSVTPLAALQLILDERRKELPFTGQLRWEDLRRLNMDTRFAKTLVRTVNGQQYTLLPNDRRYVYPIPDNEIQASGIEQNIR
jgi:tetratricopeptide (TPR) repeat protein